VPGAVLGTLYNCDINEDAPSFAALWPGAYGHTGRDFTLHGMKKVTAALVFGCYALLAWADDWSTNDGRVYKDVKIVKQDAIAVSILDSDGQVEVPLSSLPADLQKRLGYDPEKAAALAKERADQERGFREKWAESCREELAKLKGLISEALSFPATKAMLYSIEPEVNPLPEDKTVHRFKILGQMELDREQTQLAANGIQKAGEEWDGAMVMCFNPRHVLSISSGGHIYEFVICYECESVHFYKDDKRIGEAGVFGSSEFFDDLFVSTHVPHTQTGIESPEVAADVQNKLVEEDARWFSAMPKSVQAKWDWTQVKASRIPDAALARGLVDREYLEVNPRVLKLLEWYGSGAGPWSGYPTYEELPGLLLFDYPTKTILSVIQSTTLNDAQIEGTARFFGSWDFSQRRPQDIFLLPASLKQVLLAHSLKSNDSDKVNRAKATFR
jgi:hypothetical protein